MHLHGHRYWVTGSDGGRWPQSLWRPEATEIVGVGQTRDIEFIANPGDWAFHCHMSHHTMNAMGHGIANPLGVDQSDIAEKIQSLLPGYIPMGEGGMAEHSEHLAMSQMGDMKMEGMKGMHHGMHHGAGFKGPRNTLPMMTGEGPFGSIEMGGMFTVVKIRDGKVRDKESGWYDNPPGTVAGRIG